MPKSVEIENPMIKNISGLQVQIDPDILQWFQSQDEEYALLINSVLRCHMESANSELSKIKQVSNQQKKSLICPSCHAPLLSRISPLCNSCGEKVPKALLHSAEKIAKIDANEKESRLARIIREGQS